jgi:uncharacterized protein YndB with AHSA1/START domain
MMTAPSTSVEKQITVHVPVEKAFAIFTEHFDTWWPRSHHIGAAEMDRAVLERRAGGRWYEIGTDGSECEWGRVVAWEPPGRLVLAWQINPQWQYDSALVTEVDVRFTAVGPNTTRVDLEHRHLDRVGPDGAEFVAAISGDGGWGGLLKMFADAAEAA